MDRRRESRVDTPLPVRIWGVDSYSRPFMQMVTVGNIGSQKAQFRVVWAGMAGAVVGNG